MRFIFSRQKLISFYKFSLFFALLLLAARPSEAGGGTFTIPPLDKIIPLAIEKNQTSSRSAGENKYLATKYYYQIQYRTNQLDVAEEVKGRFETAIEKAEERYEKGEGEVSQSDITKLKLGHTGSENDVIKFRTEIHISKLALAELTGLDLSKESTLEEDLIKPVDFSKKSFKEVFGATHNSAPFEQKKAFLKVNEARDQMGLAKSSRKITRALLVTELANYDFGIGSPGDLFQALIIYTRVLSGYYETVYKFNLAVAQLNREIAK